MKMPGMQYSILSCVVAMLCLSSCSKKDKGDTPDDKQKYVSTIAYQYGSNNATTEEYLFSYDSLKHVMSGTMFKDGFDLQYQNDAIYTNGKLTGINGSSHGAQLYTKAIEYNAANRISAIKWMDVSNQIFQVDSLFYDDKTQPQRIYTYKRNAGGKMYLFEKQTGTYDSNGNVVNFKSDSLDSNTGAYVTYYKEDYVYDDYPTYYTNGILPFMNNVRLPMYSKNNPRVSVEYWGVNLIGTATAGISYTYDEDRYPTRQFGNVAYIGVAHNTVISYTKF
ncbi:hypothetical protein [Chitinophaga sp. Cy-1792]|uniref:hypothetical protein n=1 Tax=Chitinophaga sp. Cy-1792 TaxID=2608339 RepID=UPI001423411A|nr:hypothetical protein [Chitinophaga sp. Cy-1792]NIG55806.1 hypothetical protein [Chitinophaga sp. Cy-1792]